MENKEERIYIDFFKEDFCKNCCDNKYCKTHNIKCNCKIDYDKALTRQEAIKRLAIGWCSANEDCNYCDDGEKGSEDCLNYLTVKGKLKNAESALDALLEGGK